MAGVPRHTPAGTGLHTWPGHSARRGARLLYPLRFPRTRDHQARASSPGPARHLQDVCSGTVEAGALKSCQAPLLRALSSITCSGCYLGRRHWAPGILTLASHENVGAKSPVTHRLGGNQGHRSGWGAGPWRGCWHHLPDPVLKAWASCSNQGVTSDGDRPSYADSPPHSTEQRGPHLPSPQLS